MLGKTELKTFILGKTELRIFMLGKTELRILMLGKNNFEKFPIGVRSVRTLGLVRWLSTCSSVWSYALSWINEGPTFPIEFRSV